MDSQAKMVIALVGHQGTGKDFLTRAIQNYCGEDKVGVYSTGDIIRGILGLLRQPHPREVCNATVNAVVEIFGGDVLSRVIDQQIREDPKPVIVFNCMRRLEDEAMVRRLPYKKLTTYLYRSMSERVASMRERSRVGEGDLSEDQLAAKQKLDQEAWIDEIGGRAKVQLHCRGTPDELDTQKLAFCQQYLREYGK